MSSYLFRTFNEQAEIHEVFTLLSKLDVKFVCQNNSYLFRTFIEQAENHIE